MSAPTILNINTKLLLRAENNPNVMEPRQYKLLVEAIRTVGFLQPILVRPSDGAAAGTAYRVIDGHHRLAAAEELGMQQVPCVVVERDQDEEVILRIAMNKLRGELDLTGVGRALKELSDAGWATEDLQLTGFSTDELVDLMRAVSQNVDAALPTDMEVPAPEYEVEDGGAAKPLLLELLFSNLEDMKRAKRGLKRAAGKGKDMAVGLLRLLGEETTDQARKEES